jgi:adenine-specific DNA-methyltransferase
MIYILVYCKNPDAFSVGSVPRTEEQKAKFQNPDGDTRGPWKAENLSAGKYYSAGQFEIVGPTGLVFLPPKNRYWRCNAEQYQRWLKDGRITFGLAGTGRPMLKKFLAELDDGLTPNTWWAHQEVGSNKEASLDLKALFANAENVFQTPKPEKLIQRVLSLSTAEGDLVLDSFAGSGTTGAVAHKMGRRWIMVELGEHCHTHIIPRLRKVVDGEDPGGVTEATGWQGGGGFRYFRLAPSLLEKDPWGEWVVSKQYNAAMLAEAVCKHEGFRYEPSQEVYWQHGRSTERDYLFVTTQTLTRPQLTVLSEQVGPNRSLLICCGAFRAGRDEFANLTLKKIPQAVLHRCEWGKDDYSLHITEALADRDDDEPVAPAPGKAKPGRPKVTDTATLSLFDGPGAPPAPAAPRGRGGKKKS